MTKPTQDKETLREAVARALCELRIRTIRRHDTPSDELEAMLPAAVNHVWREHLPQADAAIATMFERLRTPLKDALAFTVVVSNLLTPLKAEWEQEGAWREYDEQVFQQRAKVAIQLNDLLTAFQQENSDER